MVDDVPRNPDKANSCDVEGDEKARPNPESEEYDTLEHSKQEKRKSATKPKSPRLMRIGSGKPKKMIGIASARI